MITPAQVKTARKLLGWSQMTLALEAGVAATTIGSLETARKVPSKATLATIQSTLERAGVLFAKGEPQLARDKP
jgi:transcriptional regulator with XRE-family HTH domain